MSLLGKISRRGARLIFEGVENRIYRRHPVCSGFQADLPIMVDAIGDLEKFRPAERWHDKEVMLKAWHHRIAAGCHAYSIADRDRLLHLGWVQPSVESSVFTETGLRFVYPPRSAAIYEFYTDPSARGRGYYQATVARILTDLAASHAPPEWIYVTVLADNAPSRHVIEKLGFVHLGSQFKRRILGWTQKWTTV